MLGHLLMQSLFLAQGGSSILRWTEGVVDAVIYDLSGIVDTVPLLHLSPAHGRVSLSLRVLVGSVTV